MDKSLINLISNTNHKSSSIIGTAERKVLEILQVNCNSPIGVFAFIDNKNFFTIKAELFSHNGLEKYVAKAFDRINDEMFKFRHSMGVSFII